MDAPMLIAVTVLIVIAGIEVFCLFICKKDTERMPLTVAVPVFSDSELLNASLERVKDMMLRGCCSVDRIILINYDADGVNSEICNEFCRDFREAVFIYPEEIEKKLAEIFAFTSEM